MNIAGLTSCARYAYPPNSLSLCGPEKQEDLKLYVTNQKADKGTTEVLSAFSTLYSYLSFIAYENNIRDPFDRRVVEAYWLGNKLLDSISISKFSTYLKDTLRLKKKIKNKYLDLLPPEFILLVRKTFPFFPGSQLFLPVYYPYVL